MKASLPGSGPGQTFENRLRVLVTFLECHEKRSCPVILCLAGVNSLISQQQGYHFLVAFMARNEKGVAPVVSGLLGSILGSANSRETTSLWPSWHQR